MKRLGRHKRLGGLASTLSMVMDEVIAEFITLFGNAVTLLGFDISVEIVIQKVVKVRHEPTARELTLEDSMGCRDPLPNP